MKNIKTLALAAVLALTSVSASAQVKLKLGHAAPETDLQQAMSLYFKEQVESRSKGAITVTVFPQGQLGNDAQMIDGTRSGMTDITISGLNNFTGLVPEAGVFELPFIFPIR